MEQSHCYTNTPFKNGRDKCEYCRGNSLLKVYGKVIHEGIKPIATRKSEWILKRNTMYR